MPETTRKAMLHINDLTYRIGGRVLFDRATAAISGGERVGLVGRNGAGKTTLLRLIAGELAPDGGDVRVTGRTRVGRVRQEAPGGPESLIDWVLATDVERTRLLEAADTAHEPAHIAEIHERLSAIEAHAAPAKAARILAGLGFDERAQARPCGELSGGWRMRVALAALLYAEPDLLLLDEPTNHLDLEATLWLESYLKGYPGTVFLVSHDRDLLNRAVNKILHLEDRRLTLYSGNYDRFERTRREHLARQADLHAKQLAERRRIQAFVDRFRAKASKARMAQSRLKMLERMEPIAGAAEERTVHFEFPKPEPLSPPLIRLEDAAAGYDVDEPVLADLNLRLDMDDRVALLGANGNGKSTLVKLLSGRLKPLQGKIVKSSKLVTGYFAQDQADELDLGASPLKHMARLMPMATETKLRAQLGRFGFGADKAEVAVGQLSGGEKARLLFALMSREAPQILFLDEPTNHLDIDSREALVHALNAFDGAVVLVTHDPHLVELVADRLWLVADGRAEPYEGDLDDYRRLLLERRRDQRNREAERSPGAAESKTASRKDERRAKAEARQAIAPLKKAARAAEERLERLHGEIDEIERQMADPSLYDGNPQRLTDLQIRHAELKDAVEKAEDAWLEAQHRIEAQTAARGR
ncbi:MAG: ATP-binding cassette domain-containing protein [Rhodovibrionaceae bacterium]|nr:ATP-binding cassette domain-containing protein [Rhodovibrionaceae bacterium]